MSGPQPNGNDLGDKKIPSPSPIISEISVVARRARRRPKALVDVCLIHLYYCKSNITCRIKEGQNRLKVLTVLTFGDIGPVRLFAREMKLTLSAGRNCA